MPRINFEDSVWLDVRFSVLFAELIKRFPTLETTIVRQLAAGALLSAWRVAQQYYTDKNDPGAPIPSAIWRKSGLCDELITADFAEPVEGGIRMRGAEAAFEWILERREAGSKGGNATKESRTTKKSNNQVQQTDSKPQQTIASYSYSSSFSNKNTNTNTNTFNEGVGSLPVAVAPAARKKTVKKEPTEGTEVWNAYRDSMLKTWNMDPPRSAKTASQANQLVSLVGFEKAKELATYFPTRRSNFYVSKGHPFGLLLSDHMALLRELSAGMKMTKEVVDEIVGQESLETHEQLRKLRPSIYSEEWEDWYEKQQRLGGKTNELLS
jgi:hypothetical protein